MNDAIEREFWHIEYPRDAPSNLLTGCLVQDFESMSTDYYLAGRCVLAKVLKLRRSRYILDFVFPVAIYLFRHTIELALKAVICASYDKPQISFCFQHEKHDLSILFNRCRPVMEKVLCSSEIEWFDRFVCSARFRDPSASLFRYPLQERTNNTFDILITTKKDYVDIGETSKTLITAYELVSRCFMDNNPDVPVLQSNFNYLTFTDIGIGNYPLRKSKASVYYCPFAEGFSDAAKFLHDEAALSWREKCFPLLFLLRHTIELGLKHLARNGTVAETSGRLGHKLIKIWEVPKSMIEERAKCSGWDLSPLIMVNKRLEELNALDANGFLFRYPVNKSLEYKIPLNAALDVRSVYESQMGIINFLDGCSALFDKTTDF